MLSITQEEMSLYTTELRAAVMYVSAFFGPAVEPPTRMRVFARSDAPWSLTLSNADGHHVGIGNRVPPGSSAPQVDTPEAISYDLGMQAVHCLMPAESAAQAQFHLEAGAGSTGGSASDDGSWRIKQFTVMEQGMCVWAGINWVNERHGKVPSITDPVDYAALEMYSNFAKAQQIAELRKEFTYLERISPERWKREFGRKAAITNVGYFPWRNEVLAAASRENNAVARSLAPSRK